MNKEELNRIEKEIIKQTEELNRIEKSLKDLKKKREEHKKKYHSKQWIKFYNLK